MRNLKKVLSLTLALVMLLGMMVVGAGAAEYTDADSIQYKEAVEVMSAIGVIDGKGNNQFDPEGNLTRAEAAKLITYMVLGKSVANKLPNTGSKFVDCPENEWYVGSVNYLTDTGIISGVGNGMFDPESNVTGVEFAKMLLGILGYDAKNEKFVDDPSWAANIAVKAHQAGLDLDMTTQTVSTINTLPLNRDQAAMMGFNTLKATMQYYNNAIEVTNPDGTTIKVGGTLTPVANQTGKDYRTSGGDSSMQFCEQYFPGLKLTSSSTTDIFGRSANEWKLDNKSVSKTAKNSADATFTAKTNAAGVKAQIGDDAAGVSATQVKVDGKAHDTLSGTGVTAAEIAKLTGNGRVVEVYLNADDADKIDRVVVINTELVQITRINSSAKTVTLKKTNNAIGGTIATVGEKDPCYDMLSGMEKDDYVLVTAAWDDDSKYVVQTAVEPEVITGTLSKVSKNSSGDVTGITMAGTDYKLAAANVGFSDLSATNVAAKQESTLYCDTYSNAVFIKDITVADKYVMAASKYQTLVDGKIVTMLRGIATDGTMVELNVGTQSPTAGTIYKYESATATEIAGGADYKITALDAAADGSVTASAVDAIKLNATGSINAGDRALVQNQSTANTTGAQTLFAKDVTFIYVDSTSFNVTAVKTGVQRVSAIGANSLALQTQVGGTDVVSVVYLMNDAESSVGTDLAYVSAITGNTKINGRAADIYTLYIKGEKVENIASTTQGLTVGTFAAYSEASDKTSESGAAVYNLTAYTTSTGKVTSVKANQPVTGTQLGYLLTADSKTVDVSDAVWVDLSGANIENVDDVKAAMTDNKTVNVSFVYNDVSSAEGYLDASYVFINSAKSSLKAATIKVNTVAVTSTTEGSPTDCSTASKPAITGVSIAVSVTEVSEGASVKVELKKDGEAAYTALTAVTAGNYTYTTTADASKTDTVKITITAADGSTAVYYGKTVTAVS